MPYPDDQLPLLDTRRGDSQYIRASDIIAAAPRDVRAGSARFRFHHPARQAGRWVAMTADHDHAAFSASMARDASDRPEWGFRLEQPAMPLREEPAIGKARLFKRAQSHPHGASCALGDPELLWDHLMMLGLGRWDTEFPAGTWSVAGVDVLSWPVPPPAAGVELRVELMKRRKRAFQFSIAISDEIIGHALFGLAGPDAATT